MANDNQRELAQLEQRDEEGNGPELALVIVEVAGRDDQGRIHQFRGIREATAEDLAAHPHLLRGAVVGAWATLAGRLAEP